MYTGSCVTGATVFGMTGVTGDSGIVVGSEVDVVVSVDVVGGVVVVVVGVVVDVVVVVVVVGVAVVVTVVVYVGSVGNGLNGGNGMIGIGRVARAKPDGYTLAFSVSFSTHVVHGAIHRLPYDVINDFEPLALVTGQSARDPRKESHAGKRPERTDRVAKDKP